jgi:hypothetical protein
MTGMLTLLAKSPEWIADGLERPFSRLQWGIRRTTAAETRGLILPLLGQLPSCVHTHAQLFCECLGIWRVLHAVNPAQGYVPDRRQTWLPFTAGHLRQPSFSPGVEGPVGAASRLAAPGRNRRAALPTKRARVERDLVIGRHHTVHVARQAAIRRRPHWIQVQLKPRGR